MFTKTTRSVGFTALGLENPVSIDTVVIANALTLKS